MTLPVDWAFTPNHTGLDETGRIGTGEETLADFACTVALSFGAGLMGLLAKGQASAESFGAQLRGHLLEDDRIEEVGLKGQTRVGKLTLPIVMTPSDGPHRLSGPLTPELIEDIIADMGLEDGDSA